MSRLRGALARLRLILGRQSAESRMEKEFDFHIEMETDRLVRERGLERDEARRRALVAFGGVERHKEDLRADRGIAWLSGMKLDFRLGVRMLRKYPGLTITGVLGMAVAVAIGAVSFGIIYDVIDPSLPLEGGDRVVALQNIDTRRNGEGRETHLHDMPTWRTELSTVELIGAYRTVDRNLITPRARPEPVRVAEMSAAGFRVTRVPPLMGRYFNEEDERPGAPPVVVIGHGVWQDRFLGRPDIIGAHLQLGATAHTVIGVMPEGFAFPINNRIWTPLRLDPADYPRGDAPPIDVFGRLAPEATLEEVQAQMVTIGRRLATESPRTHEGVNPRVLPYPRVFLDAPQLVWAFHGVQLLVTMLLVVIGTNVAVLVYARTATRMGEIAVRSALGASRSRIVGQLFAEALVLSAAAAVVGLVAARFALRQVDIFIDRLGGEQVPFWIDFDGISPGLVLYVAGLAVLAAVIVGVLPALKATRRDVQANLQHLGAGGSGMRLGKVWTFLIVTQVAIAVTCLPVALSVLGLWAERSMTGPVFATREILTAELELDREGAAAAGPADAEFAARFAALKAEVVRRLEAEPRVSAVALAGAVPGEEPNIRMEVERPTVAASPDTAAGPGSAGHLVEIMRAEPNLFDALGLPLLAGRGFDPTDVSSGATTVIVNQSFVQKVLGGGDALGRRIRRVARDAEGRTEAVRQESWFTIIGVVPDFPAVIDETDLAPKVYQPVGSVVQTRALEPGRQRTVEGRLQRELPGQPSLAQEGSSPSTLVIRVRDADPAGFAARLRDVTVSIDPMLRLSSVATLQESLEKTVRINRLIGIAIALLTVSVLLLSAAGIYALMSFTITRRRREIGIRSALGAGARSVLWSVLSRAMVQIAIGITIGISLATLMDRATDGGTTAGRGALVLPAVALLMALVGLIAAIGPARRALAIQPTEALRSDG